MILDQQFFIILGGALTLVLVLFFAFNKNSLATQKKASQRMKSMQVDPKTKQRAAANVKDEKQRRKMREESLKTLDAKQAANADVTRPNLATRLSQAGMDTTVKKFYTSSVIFGVVVAFLSLIFGGLPILFAIGLGFVAGFGVPRWFVNFKRKRRFKKFTLAFPGAIDVIVRGIKSGLPLNDCLRIIASDAEEPVRGEFRKIVDSTQVGLSVPEAVERLYESIPTSETNFFAIVINIQSSAGGNLSEALGNLSNVLRERRKMSDKIKAFSTEAKASGMIIGSLPFVVAGLVALTTPGYMDPLFTTYAGNKVLLVCVALLVIGIAAMKKMISFKF